jgi:hypothetical protein
LADEAGKISENLKLLILIALHMVMATNTSTWTKMRRQKKHQNDENTAAGRMYEVRGL